MLERLIKESEDVEAQIVRDIWASAPKDVKDEIGYRVIDNGSTLISGAARDSSILINRTLGLDVNGFDKALTDQAIDTYSELGVGKYFLHLQPGGPTELIEHLEARGLVPGRAWMKFQRPPRPVDVPETALEVREVTPETAPDMGRIIAGSFGMTPAFGRALAAASALPNWHVFMALDDGAPAGCGCLVTHNGVGLLDMGATDPNFRCRGAQGAVMAARINKGVELGLTTLFTETGEAVEGEAQHSYGNILRYGFETWYARQNYMPKQD